MQLKISEVKKQKRTLRPRDRGYDANARIYVWPKGESVLDNLINRRSRPYNEYRKLIQDANILPEGVRIKWSQTAGCACGCSPGFIVDRRIYVDDGYGFVDLHITVVDANEPAKEPEVDESYLRLVA